MVTDWRAGLSPRDRLASSPVPGWQPPQSMMKGQVPNGPGYERLVSWNILRFAKDGTSSFFPDLRSFSSFIPHNVVYSL